MPAKRNSAGDTISFTVTISKQAGMMIDQLIPVGLHGSSRGEVTRTLIHSRLEQLFAEGVVGPGKRDAD